MKKVIIMASVVTLVAIGGVSAYLLTRPHATAASEGNALASSLTPAQEQGQPARSAEIKGIVKSIEGNDLIIANEIDTVELTTEQQAAQKAERQALSQEERQALKAQETATAKIENTNIMIPVGVQIKKTTGDTSGTLVGADLSDVKKGTYVWVWVDGYHSDKQSVIFLKVKGSVN
ncbi:MAG: hypothetical protein ABI602_00210 [Candidatus Saccharibacteria bacterium]